MPLLHIDSRFRTNQSSISNSTFNLTRPIRGVTRARVRSVSFFNTFNNVSADDNQLVTSSGAITIVPAFYVASTLVAVLDAQLAAAFGGAGPYVAFDASNNTLNWTLGTNTVDGVGSSMAETLGLDENATITGTFQSPLHLAFPSYLSMASPSFTSHEQNVHAGRPQQHIQVQPFVTIPISSGYLGQKVHDPALPEPWMNVSNTLSTINIRLFDPSSGREYEEASHWSGLIEFE